MFNVKRNLSMIYMAALLFLIALSAHATGGEGGHAGAYLRT